MTTWDLQTDDGIIEVSDTYHHLMIESMREELARGEILPHPVRRENIAKYMGLPQDVLLATVERGIEINYERETAHMTDEERQARDDAWAEFLDPLIEQAVAEQDARKAEIAEMDRMFE